MKEIDFLPDWYKEGKRRRVQMRRQYAALTLIFLSMLTYNLTSAHRISRASADAARLDGSRIHAETTLHQFNTISEALSEYQKRVNSVEHVDSRIDLAAVIAEISHVIGEHVVLSRVEFNSEALSEDETKSKAGGAAVRAVTTGGTAEKPVVLGDVRFRIVLAGVAGSSADVGNLVLRLEESPYFHQVLPAFSKGKDVQIPAARPTGASGTNTAERVNTFQVFEFEIVCYLSNYEEMDE